MSEKVTEILSPALHDEENPHRAIAFPEEVLIHEEKHAPARVKGVEMKRSVTQEEQDLAAAGYEHLEQQKLQQVKGAGAHDADLHEHSISLSALATELRTAFDSKDPSRSAGLTTDDAQQRILTDGENVLTPPRKKSALRKASRSCSFIDPALIRP